MMSNLFSIFDPSTQILSLSLNWISMFMVMIIMPLTYWFNINTFNSLFLSISNMLKMEFMTLMGITAIKGAPLMLITLFMLIFIINIMGLAPYIFTPTSHPVLTVTLALPLWLAVIFFGWINYTNHMFAHLVPQGTPMLLMMFMVCIETVSNIIRPLTLSVRLAANMIAGHLLMTLLASQGVSLNWLLFPALLLIQLLLLTLEFAVAMIQAYVFSVLMTLYVSETSYVHM